MQAGSLHNTWSIKHVNLSIAQFVLYPHCNMTRYVQFPSFVQEKFIRRMLLSSKASTAGFCSLLQQRAQQAACADTAVCLLHFQKHCFAAFKPVEPVQEQQKWVQQ